MELFGSAKVINLKVDGMTCEHCEMKVEKALSALPGVKKVKIDRSKKNADISISKSADIQVQAMIDAVTAAGYTAAE